MDEQNTQAVDSDVQAPSQAEALLAELCEAAGLAPDATEGQLKGVVLAAFEAQRLVQELSERVAALGEQARQRAALDAVDEAIELGKLTPAQRQWALSYAQSDHEGFMAYVANAPVVVPFTLTAKPRQSGPQTPELQGKANAIMGVSDEAFRKHNP